MCSCFNVCRKLISRKSRFLYLKARQSRRVTFTAKNYPESSFHARYTRPNDPAPIWLPRLIAPASFSSNSSIWSRKPMLLNRDLNLFPLFGFSFASSSSPSYVADERKRQFIPSDSSRNMRSGDSPSEKSSRGISESPSLSSSSGSIDDLLRLIIPGLAQKSE